jgi:hypothetical protein
MQNEGGKMKTLTLALLAGAMVIAAVPPVLAQQAPAAPEAQPIRCGGPQDDDDYDVAENDVSTCEVDPLLADAGNALGIIRSDTLQFGYVPRPVMSTLVDGMWVDTEADPAGAAQAITRYEFAPDYRVKGFREDVTLASGDRVIRVIKGDQAWNEGPTPGMNPEDVTDANIIALRKARLFLSPHGIVRAAAFASKGLCIDNNASDNNDILECPENSVTIDGTNFTVTYDGMEFAVATGEEEGIGGYPMSITVNVNGMEITRNFSRYHDGKGTGDDDSAAILLVQQGANADEIAAATAVVDEYRFGVYYPTHITETVNGNTTLDVEITSGWTNKWVPLPSPELLRSAQ